VIYTGKCNFRCPFCHNRDLVLLETSSGIGLERALQMVSLRKGFIDAVVITGGEPTIHPDLVDLIGSIKSLDIPVKLDTNGSNPGVLDSLFDRGYIDFVAMDLKTSLEKYPLAAGKQVNVENILESIDLIRHLGVPCEFRTTCVPGIVEKTDIEEITRMVGRGCMYTLQQFQPVNTLDPNYAEIVPYSEEELIGFLEIARRNTSYCRLIGLAKEAVDFIDYERLK